jgi:sulfur-oxidizing protein SoxY
VTDHATGSTRRAFLAATAGGLATMTLAPTIAFADAKTVADEIAKIAGGKAIKDGKIKLDLPSIAENGLVVPLSFEVESPMTASDYVKAVHIFAEGNPLPGIASYAFTPLSPKAAASLRIRLAKTQNVIAIAQMSNGDLYKAAKEVKVTIGGCGG